MWLLPFYYQQMKSLPYISHEKLEQLREKKFKSLIIHAYRHVPYYRRTWKELKIDPYKISLQKIDQLPLVSKEELIANYKDFIARDFANIQTERYYRSSATTSSQRFKMPFDERAWIIAQILYWRSLKAANYDPTKPLFIFINREDVKSTFLEKFGLFKKVIIPTFLHEKQQIKLFQSFPPIYLHHFSSNLFFISQFIKSFEIKIPSPQAIITTGTVLADNMRKTIEEAFNTQVFDHYASAEFGRIAFECNFHNYHVNWDSFHLEIINKDEDEKGEIVVTSFENYLLPLIRYKTGDIGKLKNEECNCGIKFPLLERIYGRKSTIIEIDSKKKLTEFEILINIQFQFPLIFQIIFSKPANFEILVEENEAIKRDGIETLFYRQLKSLVRNSNINVNITIKKRLEKSPGGKRILIKPIKYTT
jgi:phenylacetate-CoA ligase